MSMRDAASVEHLVPWVDAGVLSSADVHVAETLARLAGLTIDDDGRLVVLAAALAARAPRQGHVCLDLVGVSDSVGAEIDRREDAVRVDLDTLPWPEPSRWRALLRTSPLVQIEGEPETTPPRPLVLDGDLLYLERYRRYERQVADAVLSRAMTPPTPLPVSADRCEELLTAFELVPEQRAAAECGATRTLSVIVGGPGTGKTHTVAALLALLLDGSADDSVPLRIAAVAPTGKAAARMGEAFRQLADRIASTMTFTGAADLATRLRRAETSTIHRRLGWMPGRSGFRHDHTNPLPYDVVIVDETSMVSLPLMARLLDAVGPYTRLVLVGDHGQLASVEAGSVLGDLSAPVVQAIDEGLPLPEAPLAECVSVLTQSHRFPTDSFIGRFAAAVRTGDVAAARAVLDESRDGASGGPVKLVWHDEMADAPHGVELVRARAFGDAVAMVDAASEGRVDAALERLGTVRVLCAHRNGPFGVRRWNWQFDEWLRPKGGRLAEFYAGRPLMVTRNDPTDDLFNGDLGVVVDVDGVIRAAFPGPQGPRLLAPVRLDHVETVHALTIHKSQGSEFDAVVVIVPPKESRLSTRELLYTAVTRAREEVVLIGTGEAIAEAIGRTVSRASGLGARLWSD